LIDGLICPGEAVFSGRAGVLPNWWGWPLLVSGWVRIGVCRTGRPSLCWVGVMSVSMRWTQGSAFAAVVVEQHGFLDAGELVEQFAYRQV
jgi:hypothetical protein